MSHIKATKNWMIVPFIKMAAMFVIFLFMLLATMPFVIGTWNFTERLISESDVHNVCHFELNSQFADLICFHSSHLC